MAPKLQTSVDTSYLRGRYYWYKRTLDGVCYYKSLKIKKGWESMLSVENYPH